MLLSHIYERWCSFVVIITLQTRPTPFIKLLLAGILDIDNDNKRAIILLISSQHKAPTLTYGRFDTRYIQTGKIDFLFI